MLVMNGNQSREGQCLVCGEYDYVRDNTLVINLAYDIDSEMECAVYMLTSYVFELLLYKYVANEKDLKNIVVKTEKIINVFLSKKDNWDLLQATVLKENLAKTIIFQSNII
ncbi:MAG: hypothetical protein PHE54_05115 [Bacilli bacterium]|nr:hypothetical protein [Bacilli bacterium]